MFPEELPRRLTRMFSFAGETVLDPFLGSGTTCLAARHLGRRAMGYEINGEYLPVMERKLGAGTFAVRRAAPLGRGDLDAGLARLPYLFADPVRVERRAAAGAARYGSRVDGREAPRTDLARVAEVPAPDTVVLQNGQRLRLLGVKPLKGRERRAARRLWELVRGQQVYFRPDPECEPGAAPGEAPLVYLYLRNRTPVNRHLVRSGLVSVDESRTYRFRQAFVAERRQARRSRGRRRAD
jgi:site-specific DNA-methyltransferase (adenine-specific)